MATKEKIPGRGMLLTSFGWIAILLSYFGTFALGLILPYMCEEMGLDSVSLGSSLSSLAFLVKVKANFRNLSREEQDALIQKNPKYGHVICRCETITEGEILDAIHSPVVPTSVDAIKRRTRAGMGRCQGGFCQQKIVEILARELGKEWVEINLKDEGSYILAQETRKEAEGR